MTKAEEFALANKAFEQFTLAEREAALTEFARLRYPSIIDRFFEAVHVVITRATTKVEVERVPVSEEHLRQVADAIRKGRTHD